MRAYRLIISKRGPLLISVERLAQINAARRGRGLGDLQDGECFCDKDCLMFEDCCPGCGLNEPGFGSGSGPYPLNPAPPIDSISTLESGGGGGPDPGFDFWNWFFGSGGQLGFPSVAPGELEPVPIDWGGIATSIGTGPPATPYGVCPPGTGRGKRGAQDYECTPFDPPNTESGKRQRDANAQQQLQNAANARGNQQQQQLQQAAADCARKGGRLVSDQQGKIFCQLPNGQLEPINSGFPWWAWLLIGGAAIAILK